MSNAMDLRAAERRANLQSVRRDDRERRAGKGGTPMNGYCACAWRKGVTYRDGKLICDSCGVKVPPEQQPEPEKTDGYGWGV